MGATVGRDPDKYERYGRAARQRLAVGIAMWGKSLATRTSGESDEEATRRFFMKKRTVTARAELANSRLCKSGSRALIPTIALIIMAK